MTSRLEDTINLEPKQIEKGIKSDDEIECTAKNPAFITLKDHKRTSKTSTSCRLLNSCKSEFNKIRNLISEKANKYLADLLSLNQ